MLKSEVTCVSGPSLSSRRRSSSDSPGYDNSIKRTRRTSSRSLESEEDDDYERDRADDDDEEDGEVSPKTTIAARPKAPPSSAPLRTGGLYMPPAKLRLLQVDTDHSSRFFFHHY
jgi:hypothetical protein